LNTGDLFGSSRLRIVSFAVAMLLSAGCDEQTAVTSTAAPAKKTMTEDAADLTLALGSLRQLAEGSDVQPAQRTIFYLNQWISADPGTAKEWQQDRLLDSLPRALRNTPGLDRLSSLQFTATGMAQWLDDLSFLQQNLWLHDIAQRARREPAPAYLQPWLKEIESSIGLPESEQLATAERMLDWTTRNIQLDPLPPTPKGPEAKAGSTETILPASRGDVGPGYGHLPLEVLLYGHGDAHERARIFILLCRQVGIDAVMLGFQEEQAATRRGWLPVALVGGKLYLFDSGLGLPVPGPEGKGIATLDQVVKEPQLLRQLDVEGVPPYPTTEKDLKSGVFAMIDAEPAALSRRMQLLQAAMPAAMRLALTTRPAELEASLRKANVSQIRLWEVPYEAILYRIGLTQRTRSEQQLAKDLYRLNVVFSPSRPLIKARNLHLQGRYENNDRKPGARSLYLQCRRPDREIEALLTNEFYRKTIGLEQSLPENPSQKEEQLAFITSIAREEKFDATFWLALTYSDVGKPGPAIEWLGKPVVEASPPSPWTPAARYNLARCYEQLGQYDLARQWLLSDKESPQRHGNRLRAKMLPTAKSGN
jgi:tetratricopeptide (TPR) repeat protein